MSLNEDKVFRIEGIEANPIDAKEATQVSKHAPNKEQFDKLMADESVKTQEAAKIEQEAEVKLPNRMEAAEEAQARIDSRERLQIKDLIAQTETAVDKIKAVKERLETANVEVSRPLRSALERKLVHIDENIKIALSKVGVDFAPAEVKTGGLLQPVQKFLGYLTNGQSQLETLGTHLQTVADSGQSMSHANMLAVQIKVGLITQQVEFFASLLNKALESTKTVMNVQV